MLSFSTLTSSLLPLPIKDIDTDMICPAEYLTSVSKEGFGQYAFKRLKDSSADFPMNNPKYAKAKIIVAGHNFGCGSSREHAVWALLDAGYRVVLSSAFSDIFASNSAKNGLLLIALPPENIQTLFSAAELDPTFSITINLETQSIELPNGTSWQFQYDSFRKYCILNGLDDINYILQSQDSISAYEQAR